MRTVAPRPVDAATSSRCHWGAHPVRALQFTDPDGYLWGISTCETAYPVGHRVAWPVDMWSVRTPSGRLTFPYREVLYDT